MSSSFHYVHAKPMSLKARLIKGLMGLIGVNTTIEKAIKSGHPDHKPAALSKALLNDYGAQTQAFGTRQLWRFAPKTGKTAQAVFYIHGGGYILNVTSLHWGFLRDLMQRTGASVVAPDYPLAPEGQCLETLDFVQSAYDDLLKTTDAKNIVIMGDSAGAGLALAFTQRLRDNAKPLPAQVILISPFLDVRMGNPGIAEVAPHDVLLTAEGLRLAGAAYAGPLATSDWRVSPIEGSLQGMPPLAVFIGTHDMFIADSRILQARAAAAGQSLAFYEYPGMFHIWPTFTMLAEGQAAIEQIAHLLLNGNPTQGKPQSS